MGSSRLGSSSSQLKKLVTLNFSVNTWPNGDHNMTYLRGYCADRIIQLIRIRYLAWCKCLI